MTILESFPPMNVVEIFGELKNRTNNLLEAIDKDSSRLILPEWQVYPGQPLTDMDCIRDIFEDIWYLGDEDGRTTRTYQGVIMGNKNIIHKAIELNKAKDSFHRAIKTLLKETPMSNTNKLKEEFSSLMDDDSRDRLSTLGLIRLNLNLCYRKVPFFKVCPLKIGYSKQNKGSSITKISKNEAKGLLEAEEKLGKDVSEQLRILETVPNGEMLARVQNQTPIIKANIKFKEHYENSKSVRLTKKPPLPIIVPHGAPFDVNFINPEEPSHSRLKRSDRIIYETPFLPSIRAHRYIL